MADVTLSDLKIVLDTLCDGVNSLKADNAMLMGKVSSLEEKLKQKDEKIKCLEGRVEELEGYTNEMKRYSLKNNIIIKGLKINKPVRTFAAVATAMPGEPTEEVEDVHPKIPTSQFETFKATRAHH